MKSSEYISKKAENIAKREILLMAMEDIRILGNTELHLKYLEMYESLRSESKEIERTYQNTNTIAKVA